MVLFDFARTSPERDPVRGLSRCRRARPVRTPTDFSLLIAQLGTSGRCRCAAGSTPATSDTERAYALRGIEEFLDDPLEWATIDSILAVVTDLAQQVVPAGQQHRGRRRGPWVGTACRRSTWTSACLRPVRAATCATSPLISSSASTSRHDDGGSVRGSGVQEPGGAPPQSSRDASRARSVPG